MTSPRKFSAALTLLLIIAGSATAADKIQLKINFKKGDSRILSTVMDLNNKIMAGELNIDMKMKMGFDLSFNVQDVNAAGLHSVKIGYDRVLMSINGPIKIEYDSAKEKDNNNPLTKAFAAMVGQSMSVKMKPTGEVTEISGIDELAEKLGKHIPGGAAAAKKQLEGTKNQLGQSFANFPPNPVGIGDTWNARVETSTDPNMPMSIDMKYTLVDRKNGEAVVKLEGKITSKKVPLTGSMNGTLRIDEQTGWTNRGDMIMKMAGNVQGTKMAMDAKITVGGMQK